MLLSYLNNGFEGPYASMVAPVTAEEFSLTKNEHKVAISDGSIM
jgi:hypothetical protein